MLRVARSRLEPTLVGRVWRQLSELGFINSSLQFAAVFTLGFIPFLMLVSAALGPGLTRAIVTRSGFSTKAADDLALLFTHARTAPAGVTVLALVLAVLGGGGVAHLVQAWYAKTFQAPVRGWKAIARRAQWLAGVFGFLALQAAIGRRVQPHAGDIAAASAQFLLALAFWWWSLHALLAGQVPWRRLFPAGLATATCYTGLMVYIAWVMSSSIVADDASYGPIGAVITLLTAEVGLAVVLQLGAAIGATIERQKYPGSNPGPGLAMTSFRDACAQPGLSLPEIARVVDQSVTQAAGEEDFVTAVFAELDPGGWLQLVICGHPDLQAAADGLLSQLRAHSGRQLDDDVTLLLLEATSPAGAGPSGDVAPASMPGTLKSMCLKCGKSIIQLVRSPELSTQPDRSSWMTNDSDGDAVCHARPGGMPHQPQNDATVPWVG